MYEGRYASRDYRGVASWRHTTPLQYSTAPSRHRPPAKLIACVLATPRKKVTYHPRAFASQQRDVEVIMAASFLLEMSQGVIQPTWLCPVGYSRPSTS